MFPEDTTCFVSTTKTDNGQYPKTMTDHGVISIPTSFFVVTLPSFGGDRFPGSHRNSSAELMPGWAAGACNDNVVRGQQWQMLWFPRCSLFGAKDRWSTGLLLADRRRRGIRVVHPRRKRQGLDRRGIQLRQYFHFLLSPEGSQQGCQFLQTRGITSFSEPGVWGDGHAFSSI